MIDNLYYYILPFFYDVSPDIKKEYIKTKYNTLCNTKSDINEHLNTLYEYALNCESILELGVRGCVSSWAFTYGLLNNNKSKKKLILNDLTSCPINELLYYTNNLVDIKPV
jgi:hypothetical protein